MCYNGYLKACGPEGIGVARLQVQFRIGYIVEKGILVR
jgi:hypothetical protein